MPRGSKKTAHQHNNRHENGIVAPGKRIIKQKSNGHINGSTNVVLPSDIPLSASSSNAQTQGPDRRTDESRNSFPDADELFGGGARNPIEDKDLLVNRETNGGILDRNHRKIDVNAAKSPAVHDSTPLSLALTILWSCPLGDTLAILIFLLSLPPTMLTLTNTLFAMLTFMPPSNSLSSFPRSLNNMFQGSSGAPSFATIFLTDVIGLLLWIVLWPPVQVVVLELAQAVVAATLGGGNSPKNKGSDHTIVCMGIVVVSHVARHKWIQNRFFGHDWAVWMASFSNLTWGAPDLPSNNLHNSYTFFDWYRLLITLHILIQGIVHVVRRWYARRGHTPSASIMKKADPDSTAGSPNRSDGLPPSSPAFSAQGTPQEVIPKSSIPNARETREKSNKKKRKQGTLVRSQQPLWAAFAATKVTVCRELDQSNTLQEANGSNATDSRNLGDAPFKDQEGCVWITQIHLTRFSFAASHFPRKRPNADIATTASPEIGSEMDQSTPFFVRINGADWSSTVVRRLPAGEPEDVSAGPAWEGEVSGLSPSSRYICSFVRDEDGLEIYSTMISTPSSSPPAQEPLATVTPPLQAHRPSSPTSPRATLKNSMAALEATKVELLARQKRSKKDSKNACASLRKDIDILNSKITKISNEDKVHQNRQLQWNQQSRQADEAVAAMSSELDLIGCIPEEDQAAWTSRKHDWEEERRREADAEKQLSHSRASTHQEKTNLQVEAANHQQKRERLTARATKLQEQLQRLHSANAQGLDEKERRVAELTAKAQDRRQSEEASQAQKAYYERQIGIAQRNIQEFKQQIESYSNAYSPQPIVSNGMDDSTISESQFPASLLPSSSGPGFSFPAFGHSDQTGVRTTPASFRQDQRPRSTSLISNNTGAMNDFDDQDPAPPMPSTSAVGTINGRRQSGSAGGSILVRLSPVHKSGSPVWN